MSIIEAIDSFFQTQGFMPHGMCLLWKPSILWTMVVSNIIIAISYFTIPLALLVLILRRKDIAFKWIFVFFVIFITTCGITHVMGVITLWNPVYGWQAFFLALTAIASAATAILIWPLIPVILQIPSPWLLKKMNKELEDSNKELDEFAYVASHDLREPLRGINNFSTFLLEDYYDKLDEEGKKQLKTLKKLSERMEGLIDNILLYSQAGRIEFAYKEVNLNEVVSDRIELLASYLEEENATVTIKHSLPIVACDDVRIGEVFQNLIVNGVKYNNQEQKQIAIDYTEEPDQYVFSVEDNGIGIQEEHFDSIFKMFKQLHPKDKYSGMGFGLTMAKKIIERHGGHIWLSSEPEKGTTFYFSLLKSRPE